MEYIIRQSQKELSQKKLEEYANFAKIINAGRKNPIWFSEFMYGIKLMDYQKWAFMESWSKPFVLWLEGRGAGKTTKAAVFLLLSLTILAMRRQK